MSRRFPIGATGVMDAQVLAAEDAGDVDFPERQGGHFSLTRGDIMQTAQRTNRRNFLKQSAAGAAAAIAAPALFPSTVLAKRSSSFAGKEINPSIDNLRVVCCYDPEMVLWDNTQWGSSVKMESQNAPVVAEKVHADLDAMAMELAQKSNAASAWATIFRKPDGKNWGDIVVAIKVNAIGVNHPRLAVINKICQVLIGMGVAEDNIWIYDASRSAESIYSAYIGNGLPAGCHISDGNGSIQVPVSNYTLKCTDVIAESDGSGGVRYKADILVNIAVNKNHGYGGFTLTLKNHIGTLKWKCPSNEYELCAMYESDAITGGTPPRQQLCIVDSIWASTTGGPTAQPDRSPHRLVMGVFGPAVDVATVKHIREPMGANHDDETVEHYMSYFGYSSQDIEYIEIDGATSAHGSAALLSAAPAKLNILIGSTLTSATVRCGRTISTASLYLPNGRRAAHAIFQPVAAENGAEIRFPGVSLRANNYLLSVAGAGWKQTTRIHMQ